MRYEAIMVVLVIAALVASYFGESLEILAREMVVIQAAIWLEVRGRK